MTDTSKTLSVRAFQVATKVNIMLQRAGQRYHDQNIYLRNPQDKALRCYESHSVSEVFSYATKPKQNNMIKITVFNSLRQISHDEKPTNIPLNFCK